MYLHQMVSTKKLSKMGRRRFLNTMAGLGISSVALQYMTKDALAQLTDNPEKEVPRLLGLVHTNHDRVVNTGAVPKREPRYYTISRDRWARTEATHAAAEKVSRLFASEPYVEVSVSNRDSELGIEVDYLTVERADGTTNSPSMSYEKVKEVIPRQVTGQVEANGKSFVREGIHVSVNRSNTREQVVFDSKYRPVPGGAQLIQPDGVPGTLGTPATALQDSSQCWVTAGHCINRTAGTPIDQPRDPDKIGEGRQYTQKGNGDVGTVVSSGPDNAYNIADKDGNYGWQISGVLGRDKLKDMNQAGDSLYLQGRSSGRQQGTVIKVDTTGTEWVYVDYNLSGGDSGGPYFHVTRDGYALIAAIHSQGVDADADSDGESRGNTMAWVEGSLDVRV